jgi:hypothetical protein
MQNSTMVRPVVFMQNNNPRLRGRKPPQTKEPQASFIAVDDAGFDVEQYASAGTAPLQLFRIPLGVFV